MISDFHHKSLVKPEKIFFNKRLYDEAPQAQEIQALAQVKPITRSIFEKDIVQAVLRLRKVVDETYAEMYKNASLEERRRQMGFVNSAFKKHIIKEMPEISNRKEAFLCIEQVTKSLSVLPILHSLRKRIVNNIVFQVSNCPQGQYVSFQRWKEDLRYLGVTVAHQVFARIRPSSIALAKSLLQKYSEKNNYRSIYEIHFAEALATSLLSKKYGFDIPKDEFMQELKGYGFYKRVKADFKKAFLSLWTTHHFVYQLLYELELNIEPLFQKIYHNLGRDKFVLSDLDLQNSHILDEVRAELVRILEFYNVYQLDNTSVQNRMLVDDVNNSAEKYDLSLLMDLKLDRKNNRKESIETEEEFLTFKKWKLNFLTFLVLGLSRQFNESNLLTYSKAGNTEVSIVLTNSILYRVKVESQTKDIVPNTYRHEVFSQYKYDTLTVNHFIDIAEQINELSPLHIKQIVMQLLLSPIDEVDLVRLFAFLKSYDKLSSCVNIPYRDLQVFEFLGYDNPNGSIYSFHVDPNNQFLIYKTLFDFDSLPENQWFISHSVYTLFKEAGLYDLLPQETKNMIMLTLPLHELSADQIQKRCEAINQMTDAEVKELLCHRPKVPFTATQVVMLFNYILANGKYELLEDIVDFVNQYPTLFSMNIGENISDNQCVFALLTYVSEINHKDVIDNFVKKIHSALLIDWFFAILHYNKGLLNQGQLNHDNILYSVNYQRILPIVLNRITALGGESADSEEQMLTEQYSDKASQLFQFLLMHKLSDITDNDIALINQYIVDGKNKGLLQLCLAKTLSYIDEQNKPVLYQKINLSVFSKSSIDLIVKYAGNYDAQLVQNLLTFLNNKKAILERQVFSVVDENRSLTDMDNIRYLNGLKQIIDEPSSYEILFELFLERLKMPLSQVWLEKFVVAFSFDFWKDIISSVINEDERINADDIYQSVLFNDNYQFIIRFLLNSVYSVRKNNPSDYRFRLFCLLYRQKPLTKDDMLFVNYVLNQNNQSPIIHKILNIRVNQEIDLLALDSIAIIDKGLFERLCLNLSTINNNIKQKLMMSASDNVVHFEILLRTVIEKNYNDNIFIPYLAQLFNIVQRSNDVMFAHCFAKVFLENIDKMTTIHMQNFIVGNRLIRRFFSIQLAAKLHSDIERNDFRLMSLLYNDEYRYLLDQIHKHIDEKHLFDLNQLSTEVVNYYGTLLSDDRLSREEIQKMMNQFPLELSTMYHFYISNTLMNFQIRDSYFVMDFNTNSKYYPLLQFVLVNTLIRLDTQFLMNILLENSLDLLNMELLEQQCKKQSGESLIIQENCNYISEFGFFNA